jgi:hypothetical protein
MISMYDTYPALNQIIKYTIKMNKIRNRKKT